MANTSKTDETFDNVRDLGEKGVQQTKDAFSRATNVASEASNAFQNAFVTGSQGYKELGRKSVEIARSNANAHFDFLNNLFASKSLSQAVELQNSYLQEQMGVYAGQAKELTALTQKTLSESSKPLQDATDKATKSTRAA